MQAWACLTCRIVNYTTGQAPPERCVMHPGAVAFEQLDPAELRRRRAEGWLGVYLGENHGHRSRAKDARRGAAPAAGAGPR